MYICTQPYAFEAVAKKGAGAGRSVGASVGRQLLRFPLFRQQFIYRKGRVQRERRVRRGFRPKFSIRAGSETKGSGRRAVERTSVDPGDGDPLRRGGHQVHGLLQQSDGVVDLVVDDGLVEVVGVGPLQHLRFLLEPLKRVVLRVRQRQKQKREEFKDRSLWTFVVRCASTQSSFVRFFSRAQ